MYEFKLNVKFIHTSVSKGVFITKNTLSVTTTCGPVFVCKYTNLNYTYTVHGTLYLIITSECSRLLFQTKIE